MATRRLLAKTSLNYPHLEVSSHALPKDNKKKKTEFGTRNEWGISSWMFLYARPRKLFSTLLSHNSSIRNYFRSFAEQNLGNHDGHYFQTFSQWYRGYFASKSRHVIKSILVTVSVINVTFKPNIFPFYKSHRHIFYLLSFGARTICMENPGFLGWIQMERFIAVESFRKKMWYLPRYYLFSLLPEFPKISVPFVHLITSARLFPRGQQRPRWQLQVLNPFFLSSWRKCNSICQK